MDVLYVIKQSSSGLLFPVRQSATVWKSKCVQAATQKRCQFYESSFSNKFVIHHHSTRQLFVLRLQPTSTPVLTVKPNLLLGI